ncbi:MAG: hypothetical protein QOH47_82 [Sphingomonadales bacterium]|jgi:uncharacterized protein (DUF885 family)|nr:hypothetical protein [Sphingomonadales bacterium]
MTMSFDRRQFLLGSAAATGALALGGCAGLAVPRSDETAARTLYDSIFEGMLRASPELATGLGLDTGERFYLKSRLGDSSPAGRMSSYQPLLDHMPRLRRLDRAAFEGRERAWLDTILWLGDRMGEEATIPYGGIGGYGYPVPYVLSQLTGSYQSVPDFLDSQHRIETRADCEAYVARLEAFAANVNLEVDQARADAGRGVVPPGFILDKTLTQTRNLRGEHGQEAGLVSSLVRRAREKGVAGDWGTQAAAIVDGRLAAALDRQLALLTELRRGAGTSPAASRLPDGERFYALCLRFQTSTGLTPDAAHAVGLRQVAELSARLDPLLRREGLTQGSVGARINALRTEARYLYPNTDAGRAELLAELNRQMAAVRARMPDWFNTIPTSPMEVKRVPPAIELGAPRGYAQGPSLDGSRPGAYYINLVDTRIWPKWALPTLTYHEAIPGHLWQGSTVIENRSIPLLHRNIGVPAFGEGWGLYSEQLADEIGMYADFPQGRIGMLQSFLYRAARIVMDTGMHAKGWSREQSILYFTENVGLDPISATSEVERYVVWPGQACSYKIGHNEIVRLREEARARLGGRFDIKSFHDAVLLAGDMPLEVLASVVADWTSARQG